MLFLGTFTELREATIRYVTLLLHGTTRIPLDEFSWSVVFEDC